MRALIQRVSVASVSNENKELRSINHGLLVFLGLEDQDEKTDVEYLSGKISKLRIFDDDQGVMNLSVEDVLGDILVISQFTLHASTKKGNRPSYIKAARPEQAIPLYEKFIETMKSMTGLHIVAGWFGAHMLVQLINDGPVTIMIDSKDRE